MSIMNIIISILFGMIPEVTYFTLFLIYTKDLKEKKVLLWFLIAIDYILCIMIIRHKVLYYIAFIFFIYLILKLLYKKKAQITDIFIFGISTIYLSLISFICSLFVGENYTIYYIMSAINRILLFVPFIFRKYFNILYKKYYSLWNRKYDKKQPIKSITLRNISLISFNIFIFICNIVCLYISGLKG